MPWPCSICELNFQTLNKVTRHKEQYHSSKKRAREYVEKHEHYLEDSEKAYQDTSFVYSKSMLDKFDKSGNKMEDSEVDKILEEFDV